jgi:putative membrane protein
MKKLISLAFSTVVAATLTAASFAALAADSGLSSMDKKFITKASEANLAEVAAGQIAVTNSSDPKVKAFAQQMIDDHSKAGDELNGIAQGKGVTPPVQPDMSQRHLAAKLQKMQGPDFDKKYVKDAGVSAHKDAVKLFTAEANKGRDPDVKAFAAKTLPTIQHHYQMATDLAAAYK